MSGGWGKQWCNNIDGDSATVWAKGTAKGRGWMVRGKVEHTVVHVYHWWCCVCWMVLALRCWWWVCWCQLWLQLLGPCAHLAQLHAPMLMDSDCIAWGTCWCWCWSGDCWHWCVVAPGKVSITVLMIGALALVMKATAGCMHIFETTAYTSITGYIIDAAASASTSGWWWLCLGGSLIL